MLSRGELGQATMAKATISVNLGRHCTGRTQKKTIFYAFCCLKFRNDSWL
jgi:hypothetical protein